MRSDAEAEVRQAVVARLRQLRPGARICHEVNSALYGPNRFDVVAVDLAEIIAVEIKSERDKMDRAPEQIRAMSGSSHHSIIALHEKHLIEKETNPHAAHYGKLDGKHYLRDIPPEASKASFTWVYPEMERCAFGNWQQTGLWRAPGKILQTALPSTALDMLWRDELAGLCDSLRVPRSKRANMTEMLVSLRWHANGRDLTRGICSALRRRKFSEADPPIYDKEKTGEFEWPKLQLPRLR